MNTASNGGLGSAKRNNARTIWYSSFEETIKHMKRTPISGLLGDPQILAKSCKTTKNGATRTPLNAIQVYSVVLDTQDLYCELGENSHLALEAGVFCVI